MLCQSTFQHKGRLSLTGIHLHDTVAQVAVFYRWDTCHDLYTLNIRYPHVTGTGSHRLPHHRIVAQSYAIHLDSSTEGGITHLLGATTQRHTVIIHQRGVDGLSTRKQRRHIRKIQDLLIVKSRLVDGIRSSLLIVFALGDHCHLVNLQALLLQGDAQSVHVLRDIQRNSTGAIAQALDGQRQFTDRYVLHRKPALSICDGPLSAILHQDGSELHRFLCLFIKNLSCHNDMLGHQRQHIRQ